MTAFLQGSLRQKSAYFQLAGLIIILVFMLMLGQLFSFGILHYFFKLTIYEISLIVSAPSPATTGALKIVLISQTLFAFVFSGLIFAFLMAERGDDFLRLKKGILPFSLVLVFLIIFISQPFISWLGLVNSKMVLPHFLDAMEHMMKESEEKLSKVTHVIIQAKTPFDIIINLFMIALLPAIGEEFVFRGCLQQIMIKGFKSHHLAIILTAIVFSAIHLQFYGFLPRFFLGLLFGYLFYWSSSIWLSAAAHFMNNALVVVYSAALSFRGKPDDIDIQAVFPFYQLFLSFAGIVLCMFLIRYFQKKASDPMVSLT